MRALVLIMLASCITVRVRLRPHGPTEVERAEALFAPFRHVPVYECAAEDGSGRVVRAHGDPVKLSEGLADEPGGLWSCYRAPHEPEHASAARALTDLRIAADLTNAATCTPYPWRPLNLGECR